MERGAWDYNKEVSSESDGATCNLAGKTDESNKQEASSVHWW